MCIKNEKKKLTKKWIKSSIYLQMAEWQSHLYTIGSIFNTYRFISAHMARDVKFFPTSFKHLPMQ